MELLVKFQRFDENWNGPRVVSVAVFFGLLHQISDRDRFGNPPAVHDGGGVGTEIDDTVIGRVLVVPLTLNVRTRTAWARRPFFPFCHHDDVSTLPVRSTSLAQTPIIGSPR